MLWVLLVGFEVRTHFAGIWSCLGNVRPCNLVGMYQQVREACLLQVQDRLNCVTSQNTAGCIVSTVETSNIRYYAHISFKTVYSNYLSFLNVVYHCKTTNAHYDGMCRDFCVD